ncbi:hypothetical protein CEXT_210011 [Caerostris extrusa]|uniref:Uncharacterized protein n=1 Tax=Caerostris extrusa TaxID=172846 RepID=A0AAV4RUB1_CAEEX|nr:hypothetical protein CEXT_210011 [Caerostris extrusa]
MLHDVRWSSMSWVLNEVCRCELVYLSAWDLKQCLDPVGALKACLASLKAHKQFCSGSNMESIPPKGRYWEESSFTLTRILSEEFKSSLEEYFPGGIVNEI